MKTFGFESGPVGFRFWDIFCQTFWWTVWTLRRNNPHNWEDEVKRFVFSFCLPWRICLRPWKTQFVNVVEKPGYVVQCTNKPISKRLQEWDHLLLCSRICFKNGPGGTTYYVSKYYFTVFKVNTYVVCSETCKVLEFQPQGTGPPFDKLSTY